MEYVPTIGLEIHVELKTRTKMFCDSLNDPGEKHPNVNVCPICMGHPGTLPVINREAVSKLLTAGLALNCSVNTDTFFERKNYFYPDLPKGYQISQYQKPFCYNGWLEIELRDKNQELKSKRIRIERIHLEEDAGRLYHTPGDNATLVDYNRAGVPLMELVTYPDLESADDVRAFASELRLIMRYTGASDADMEKGQMRVEVNISLRPHADSDSSLDNSDDRRQSASSPRKSAVLGTKVEVKNINSISNAARAVAYEMERQAELLKKGEKIVQETRGWDDVHQKTISQRTKEGSADYRYFPEPDLPPIHISESRDKNNELREKIVLEEIRAQMPELPFQRRKRFAQEYNLPLRDIETLTLNKSLGDFFEKTASELLEWDSLGHLKRPEREHTQKLLKLAANYVITEYGRHCADVDADPNDTKITPENFAELIVRIFHSEVSSSGAQTVLAEMFVTGRNPAEIIDEKDLRQMSDVGELERAVGQVIAENKKAVEDYKKGKEAPMKFLIGRVMGATKGRANPQMVEELIKKQLL